MFLFLQSHSANRHQSGGNFPPYGHIDAALESVFYAVSAMLHNSCKNLSGMQQKVLLSFLVFASELGFDWSRLGSRLGSSLWVRFGSATHAIHSSKTSRITQVAKKQESKHSCASVFQVSLHRNLLILCWPVTWPTPSKEYTLFTMRS